MISVSEDWFWKVDLPDPCLGQTSSEREEDPDQDEVCLEKGSNHLGLVSVFPRLVWMKIKDFEQ